MCCGLDLTFVLLGRVAQTEDFLLAELSVVVELHLRVQAEIWKFNFFLHLIANFVSGQFVLRFRSCMSKHLKSRSITFGKQLLTISLRVFSEWVDLNHGSVLGQEECVQVNQDLRNFVEPGKEFKIKTRTLHANKQTRFHDDNFNDNFKKYTIIRKSYSLDLYFVTWMKVLTLTLEFPSSLQPFWPYHR